MMSCRTWAKLKIHSTTQVYLTKIFSVNLSRYLAAETKVHLELQSAWSLFVFVFAMHSLMAPLFFGGTSQGGITCLLLHCSPSCFVMSPLQKVLLVKTPHCCVNRNSWCDWYTWRSSSASVGRNKASVVTNTAGRVNGPDPDLEERRRDGTPGAKHFFRVNISLNVDQFLFYTWE